MRGFRVVLIGRAATYAELVRGAIEPHDVIVQDSDAAEPADVVVLPAESEAAWDRRAGADSEAFVVALGNVGEASLDPSVDALWEDPPELEDVKSVLARAREANPTAKKSTRRALETILLDQEARRDALRVQLAREQQALRELPGPPEVSSEAQYVLLDDESAFASAVRHEERRARREGTRALLFAFESIETSPYLRALTSYDVVLVRAVSSGLALRTDVSDAFIDEVREALGDRAVALPYDGDILALLRTPAPPGRGSS